MERIILVSLALLYLYSSMYCSVFSVVFTIPLQLSNTGPLLSAVEVILQHNCHLDTFNITVIVSRRCSDICQIILYNVTY